MPARKAERSGHPDATEGGHGRRKPRKRNALIFRLSPRAGLESLDGATADGLDVGLDFRSVTSLSRASLIMTDQECQENNLNEGTG